MVGTATPSAVVPGHIRMVTGYSATAELVSLLRRCVRQSARATVRWMGGSVTGSAEHVQADPSGTSTLTVACPAFPTERVATENPPEVCVRVQAQEVAFTAGSWRALDGGRIELELPDHFQESHFRRHPRLRPTGGGLALQLAGREMAMRVQDLSLGGVGVALASADARGFEVDALYGPFRMELPGRGAIAFHAEVRYRLPRVTEGSTRMGLAIRRISPDHETRLRTYLETLEGFVTAD